MKITIKNYEEYALDYLEGTLQDGELKAFEHFLEEHPEIREELEGVHLTPLAESVPPAYPGKEELLRDPAIIRAIRQPLYVPIWSVAACLFLLLGFFLWWNLTGPENNKETSLAVRPVPTIQSQHTPFEESLKDRFKTEQTSQSIKREVLGQSLTEHAPQTSKLQEQSIETGRHSELPEPSTSNPGMDERQSTMEDQITIAGNTNVSEQVNRFPQEVDPTAIQSLVHIPKEEPVERLKIQQPAYLATAQPRLSPLKKIAEFTQPTREEDSGYSLSDELANLAPSSWPGQLNKENIKEAFIPRAFKK